MITTIELTAAAFGVLGTVLLALNGPRAGWGFVAYLASNAGWIVFAWIHSHWGMLGQQIAFTASSLLGVWVWLMKPRTELIKHWYATFRNEGLDPVRSLLLAALKATTT